jgi:hypothetical protein
MILVIFLLTLSSFIRLSCGHGSKTYFYGTLESDKLVYTSITIPRYAASVELNIFTSPQVAGSSSISPYVLLKYNGLPTLEDYDDILELPTFPFQLQIIDTEPTGITCRYILLCL